MLLDEKFLRILDRLELIIKLSRNTNFAGEKPSKQEGAGMDFKDYRHYEIGDDYRYIDWNLYSRLEQLYLKEFIEERGLNIQFLIDSSNSMAFGQPRKFDLARKIAAGLGYVGLAQLDRIETIFFNSLPFHSTDQIKGKVQAPQYFRMLEEMRPDGETDIYNAMKIFVRKHKKTGLAVVITDLLDDENCLSGLKVLRIHNWQVLLIHVLADREQNPQINDNLTLIDSETGEKKDIFVDEEIVDNYKNNLNRYFAQIESFARKYGINYFRVTNSEDLEDILLKLLKKRREIR